MPPDKGIATQGGHRVKSVVYCLTVIVTCNATGTNKRHLGSIGKSASPRVFKGKTPDNLGIEDYSDESSWMNSKVFLAWIGELDQSLNHPIIIWVDNFSGHNKVPHGFLKDILLEFVKANLMAHVQPCNAGIIYTLECHYRKQYLNQSLQLHSENVEHQKSSRLMSSQRCEHVSLHGTQS